MICPDCSKEFDSDQFLILVEVKTAPTSDSISLSERDLEGITVDENENAEGYLAVLKDNDAFDCGFMFVERRRIHTNGTIHMSELPDSTSNSTLVKLSSRWEDWILTPGAIEDVYADDHSTIMDKIDHYLRYTRKERVLKQVAHHVNRPSHVHDRLQKLRNSVLTDPKKEGFLHQSLLYHIIASEPEFGCSFHFQNRVGVPDIMARVNRLD